MDRSEGWWWGSYINIYIYIYIYICYSVYMFYYDLSQCPPVSVILDGGVPRNEIFHPWARWLVGALARLERPSAAAALERSGNP